MGCGIQVAAALASALVIPTAAACSLTAAAFVRAIIFVFDLLSAAASVQVIALVVDFWYVLGLRISYMRQVETTSRIRFHGLRFWFLRLVELANSFWVCWTWNACAAAFVFLEVILMRAWAAAAFVEPHALVSVFGVCLVATMLRHVYKGVSDRL